MTDEDDDSLLACLNACNDCSRVCLQNIAHCLSLGGDHASPEHIVALTTAARVCQLTADLLALESEWHPTICDLCSQVCEEMADACDDLGDMDDCVDACQLAADSCRQIVSENSDDLADGDEDGDEDDGEDDGEDGEGEEGDRQRVRGDRMN